MAAGALIVVGEVLRPWGLQGELRVKPLTDRPEERFRSLRECVLWEAAADRREDCRIAGYRFDGPELFVRIEGVTSPEAAKRFSGRLLAVAQEDAIAPLVLPLDAARLQRLGRGHGFVLDPRHGRALQGLLDLEEGLLLGLGG